MVVFISQADDEIADMKMRKTAGPAPIFCQASSVVIHDKFVVFGHSSKADDCCWSLCLSKWTWAIIPTPPQYRRQDHCAAAIQDRYMVVYGGRHPIDSCSIREDAIRLDLLTLQWNSNSGTPVTDLRRQSSAAVLDDTIYRFGGFTSSDEWMSDLHRMTAPAGEFAKSCWEFVRTTGAPPNLMHPIMVAYGTSLFLFERNSTRLYQLQIRNVTWTEVKCVDDVPKAPPRDFEFDGLRLTLNTKHFGDRAVSWVAERRDEEGGESVGAIGNDRLIFIGGEGLANCFEIPSGCGKIRGPWNLQTREEFGRRLWRSLPCTDVTFFVEGTPIRANQVICWEFPYFRSLFSHGMEECKTGVVDIKDVSAPVFREILHYIYTGEYDVGALKPKASEDTNGLPHHAAALVEMLAAADRFLIDSLKDEIEDELLQFLDDSNCDELLSVGEDYTAPKLKRAAHYHMKAVMDRAATDEGHD